MLVADKGWNSDCIHRLIFMFQRVKTLGGVLDCVVIFISYWNLEQTRDITLIHGKRWVVGHNTNQSATETN